MSDDQTVEKPSRKERKARAKAEKEARKAAEAMAAPEPQPEPVEISGDTLASPGVGDEPEGWAAAAGTTTPEPGVSREGSDTLTDSTQRPELLIGAAFAGSFLFAKLLKRLGS